LEDGVVARTLPTPTTASAEARGDPNALESLSVARWRLDATDASPRSVFAVTRLEVKILS
jgi:hypothetical protein